jgi:hypothetical protein
MIRDKRAIVQQVLAARLSLSGPPADKASLSHGSVSTILTRQAIILSQTLHATYLGPLLAGLKTQLGNPHPFLAATASQQHTAGQGYKDTQAESSTKASDQFSGIPGPKPVGRVKRLGDRLLSREIWDGDGGLRMISELRNGGPYQRPRRRIRDLRQVR